MVPVLLLLGVVLGAQAREIGPVLQDFHPLTYDYDYQYAEKLRGKFIRLYHWHKPEFCHEHECPEYEVLKEHEGYELRRYQPSVWVSISRLHPGWLNEEERNKQFIALFRYISGNNNQNVRIPKTLPLLTRMEHKPEIGKSCQCNWTMFFMLPNKYQLNSPQPRDPNVRISTLPAMNVYVRSFSGWATPRDYKKQLGELSRAIGNCRKYSQKEYFIAGYDAPYVRHNRHNEVWFFASEQSYPEL